MTFKGPKLSKYGLLILAVFTKRLEDYKLSNPSIAVLFGLLAERQALV